MAANRPSRPTAPVLGWVRPFSVRILVLTIAALGAFAILVPTVMRYVDQQSATRALQQNVTTTTAENKELSEELDRWKDDSYVTAQARERLSFGYKGETNYKVIDPETVVDKANPQTGKDATAGGVDSSTGAKKPWYGTLWDSVEVAGKAQ